MENISDSTRTDDILATWDDYTAIMQVMLVKVLRHVQYLLGLSKHRHRKWADCGRLTNANVTFSTGVHLGFNADKHCSVEPLEAGPFFQRVYRKVKKAKVSRDRQRLPPLDFALLQSWMHYFVHVHPILEGSNCDEENLLKQRQHCAQLRRLITMAPDGSFIFDPLLMGTITLNFSSQSRTVGSKLNAHTDSWILCSNCLFPTDGYKPKSVWNFGGRQCFMCDTVIAPKRCVLLQ